MTKRKHIALTLALIGLVFGLSVSPVLARDGSSGGGGDSTETETQHAEDTNTEKPETKTETEQEQHVKEDAKPEIEKRVESKTKSESETELEKLRKEHKEHTKEERQKNCEAAKNGLETKLKNLSTNATKHQTRITEIYDKALAYQKDQNITVANFDQLVATANAAQAQAASSVSVLAGLSTTIDCSQTNVASTVATYKASAAQARTDLKAYKDAVKAILVALKAAAEKGTN